MNLREFDCQSRHNWAAAIGATDVQTVGGLVRHVMDEAITSLWQFFNRPLVDGGEWALAGYSSGLRRFASGVGSFNGLYTLCRAIQAHPLLTADERCSVAALLELGSALDLPTKVPVAKVGADMKGSPTNFSAPDGDTSSDQPARPPRSFTDIRRGLTYYRACVHHLDSKGAMIEVIPEIDFLRSVAVLVAGQWENGLVRWRLEGRIGVHFEHPVAFDRVMKPRLRG